MGKQIEGWFTFSFVRNPYTRIASEYMWSVATSTWNPDLFEDWLLKFMSDDERYDHRLPQSQILDEPVDFIGRFESLEADFQTVLNKIGLPALGLSHHEKTRYRKEQLVDSFTKRSISLINEFYAEDFKRFDYHKPLVASIKVL